MTRKDNYTIHVILTCNNIHDDGTIGRPEILFKREVEGCEDGYVNYQIALAAFKKVQKYDWANKDKPNPPDEDKHNALNQLVKDATSVKDLSLVAVRMGAPKICDLSIWALLNEAVQISLTVTKDMITDKPDDLDDWEHECENLLKSIEIYRLLQKQPNVSKIKWTLAQVEYLSFITGQLCMINDEDPKIITTLRRNNIDPCY